jgi:hypothetical protein
MKAGGHTLVQLLVAMTLASILLGAFATVHGRVRQAVSRVESLAAVQDTLTQAMAYLGNDLRQAGYVGLVGDSERLAGVAGPEDPVSLPVTNDCGINFSLRLDRPVEAMDAGYDLDCSPAAPPQPGTDVLILRRLAGKPTRAEKGRLQAGLSLGGGTLFIDDAPADSAEIRDLVTSVYYVATSRSGGESSLRRKTLVRGPRLLDEEVATGITDLQIQFGIDLDGDTWPAGANAYVNPGDARLSEPGTRILAVRVWLRAEADAPAGTVAPPIDAYANGPGAASVTRRSRQLLVRTFFLPNARRPSW